MSVFACRILLRCIAHDIDLDRIGPIVHDLHQLQEDYHRSRGIISIVSLGLDKYLPFSRSLQRRRAAFEKLFEVQWHALLSLYGLLTLCAGCHREAKERVFLLCGRSSGSPHVPKAARWRRAQFQGGGTEMYFVFGYRITNPSIPLVLESRIPIC